MVLPNKAGRFEDDFSSEVKLTPPSYFTKNYDNIKRYKKSGLHMPSRK